MLLITGAGVRGGITYGATDELGMNAIENRVHVHDLHATILHLLGIDHQKLTHRYSGRDFRLTDVYGRVVTDLMAKAFLAPYARVVNSRSLLMMGITNRRRFFRQIA